MTALRRWQPAVADVGELLGVGGADDLPDGVARRLLVEVDETAATRRAPG